MAVEEIFLTVDKYGLHRLIGPSGVAAMLASRPRAALMASLKAISPILNRYTATMPIPCWFLALLNRYIGFGCSGFENR